MSQVRLPLAFLKPCSYSSTATGGYGNEGTLFRALQLAIVAHGGRILKPHLLSLALLMMRSFMQ